MADQDQAVESPDQAPVQNDEDRMKFEQGVSGMLRARKDARRGPRQLNGAQARPGRRDASRSGLRPAYFE